ncbi:MAG TPA: hemerythrin domain-containing protein [Candidatus Binataceae bacterium]|nr:hemerythrin domain-containing protein [Candidatus Binataceae bacterium]
MNILPEAIRKHHLNLAKTLEGHVQAVGGDGAQMQRDALVAFLEKDLLPHAHGEERHLYPLVDTLVQKYGKPTATMVVDHEFIAAYVAKIEKVAQELASATARDQRGRLLRRLRGLALRLDAIVELHLAKEEQIYLPLIEERVGEERQRAVLRAIHDAYGKDKVVVTKRNSSGAEGSTR